MSAPPPREWDAVAYERVSAPQLGWGAAVLDRLELRGDETVLDAGCGTGRVTELLVQRLPAGRVIALDASAAMVAQARARLRPGDEAIVGDLLELRLERPVDAILSTATLHWILDHDRLFAVLARALRPGGRLVAQCGGEGNIAAFLDIARAVARRPPFAGHLEPWPKANRFAGPEETERRLLRAGFERARCWLHDEPTHPQDPRAFVATVILGPMLDTLPPRLRDPYLDAVMQNWPDPHRLDYVRLNIDAAR